LRTFSLDAAFPSGLLQSHKQCYTAAAAAAAAAGIRKQQTDIQTTNSPTSEEQKSILSI
jgi:hypothetical protein